jgi:hypothetical protein
MESNWRNRLTKILTAAYLVSTAAITVATSKAPEGSSTTTTNWALIGTTNYSVRSNCNTAIYNIDAIRVEGGVIRQTVDSNGAVGTSTITDFSQVGFIQPSIIVGVDQYGSGSDAAKKCIVRNKSTIANPTYDSADSTYTFMQPGSLTTVQYDCYDATAYKCSISLAELRAGSLSTVY